MSDLRAQPERQGLRPPDPARRGRRTRGSTPARPRAARRTAGRSSSDAVRSGVPRVARATERAAARSAVSARRAGSGRRRCRPRRRRRARTRARAVEQRVDLLDAGLDCDELGAALDDEPRIETVALVHLEREPAEVAQPLLANLEQRLPLALELAGGRNDVSRRPSSRSRAARSRPPRLELEDDETLLGHLADRVRRPFACVPGVLDPSVRHLVGAERRRLVDRDPAELELVARRAARP